jgi:ketopantoate reductase
MAPEALRVAVLGPGGVGGLLAALLARGGNSVEVLASESTSRAIAERGLRIESRRFGDFQVYAGAIRTRRRGDLVAVVSEVAAVAAAEGVVIDPAAVLRSLDSVPDTMESSMQRDQAAGRPLEIDAIGGAVVRRAARASVEVPVTAHLVEEPRKRA